MIIKLYEELCEKIGKAPLKKFGIDFEDRSHWQKWEMVDLRRYDTKQLQKLSDLVEPHAGGKDPIRGSGVAFKDIQTWIQVKEAGSTDKAKARNPYAFFGLLRDYLENAPGHRVFEKDQDRGVYFCYYVSSMKFYPKTYDRENRVIPAHTLINLAWIEFGGISESSETFWPSDCVGMTPAEAMNKRGYFVETKEIRKNYLDEKETFSKTVNLIGKQYLASGVGTSDLDGNDDDEDRWWRRTSSRVLLDKDGVLSNVVIDVFKEKEDGKTERDAHIDEFFWRKNRTINDDGDDEDFEEDFDQAKEEKSEYEDDTTEVEVPLHPMIACFDLRRHLRIKLHIGQLKEYVYDNNLGEKLILPQDHKGLINTLLAHKVGFKDIVKGKSGGAIVLCAGLPGTGKTLTSEVYSEVSSRCLYTVQCSQLGIEPSDLEENLLKIFTRAQRWNAILLLDEADVYVTKRGNNLHQNAIVGVFLRTLEYYNGVMFLTTNRADLVDDAIASRCVAKIVYEIPNKEDQIRIWEVIAGTSGAKISKDELKKIVDKHSNLSGRDIKNLLKLALMVTSVSGEKITANTIDFAKKYKPTEDEEKPR